MDSPDITVAIVPKNAREQFRIQIRSFHGRRFVDFRLYVVDAAGSWVPTNKGAGIRPDLLPNVGNAFRQAEEAARAEGLL